MQPLNYWKPTLVSFIILYGSITSGENFNTVSFFNFPYIDKVMHMILYFVLSLTFLASFIRSGKRTKSDHMIITFVWVVSYGILMEVFQFYFTQTRSAEILDILANTSGCIFALLLYPYLKKKGWKKIL
ncbi:MAG: VanZ family protein [Bacteroidota bacterium]